MKSVWFLSAALFTLGSVCVGSYMLTLASGPDAFRDTNAALMFRPHPGTDLGPVLGLTAPLRAAAEASPARTRSSV